jgi:hypothetical protein
MDRESMLWSSSHPIVDLRQAEGREVMSINWILIIAGAVSAAVLLVAAGAVFWLVRRARSKKA